MLEGLQTEFITVPVEMRGQIVPQLQESGIEVRPSTTKKPRRFQDAGDILTCSHGDAAVDILIVREDFLPELEHFAAVLLLPDSGFLAQFRHRTENTRLRNMIAVLLHELKQEAPGEE